MKWNGYYRDETIDKPLALDSAKAFLDYLSEYPEGRYVASAKGLVRRAHWLVGDQPTYRNMLMEAKIAFLQESEDHSSWTEEEKDKLEALFLEYKLRGQFHDENTNLSVLEAFMDPVPVSESEKYLPYSRATKMVAAYQAFAEEDFEYIVDQYGDKTSLNEAELLILARAYEKKNQIADALDVWRSDLPGTGFAVPAIDYEVSRILFRNYGVESIVKDESIANINVKRVYLASLCDSNLQQKLMGESLPEDTRHAVFVDLALRYLFANDFQELHQLMLAQPDSVVREFSAIRTAVGEIANGRSLGKAYMNVAYFLQAVVHNPIYELESYLEQTEAPQCQQNTLASGANGPYFYFNESLKFFDENEQSIDEEKSLYYLTMCFKPGSASASCLWGDRPGNGLSSKEAFTRLHAKYKNGTWASKAKYYY